MTDPEGPEGTIEDEPEEQEEEPRQDTTGAFELLQRVPAVAGLPGPAVAIIGLGITALSALVLMHVASLTLGVLARGFGGLLTVLLIAMISAYLLDPIIDRFEAKGWNRTRAIIVSLGLFLLADVVLVLLLVPYVVTEVADLGSNFGGYITRTVSQADTVEAWILEKSGREVDLGWAAVAEKLPELAEKLPAVADPLKWLGGLVAGWFGGAFGFAFHWALFPVFVFFFLRDFDFIKRALFGLIPMRWRRPVLDHYIEIDKKMALFLRGQFLLCCTLAVLYSLGLGLFTNIDLAILVGVVAGLLFIIPYFGTFIGILAGTTLAMLKFGVSFEILKVWLVFGVVQGIEGALLTPKIVGDSVGLHPVVVMLSLVVGANLFGFLGILLAVPTAAALQVLLATAIVRYRATGWFQDGADTAPTPDEVP